MRCFLLEEKQTDLDLFDLLNRKHITLDKTIEEKWDEMNSIHLSNLEWTIIERLKSGQQTISELCQTANITRQGMHKLIKKLEEQRLVVSGQIETNRRMKYVDLTDFGIECHEMNNALKIKLEDQIKNAIGVERFHQLKRVLAEDWGL